jgi:hypothetical protein
MSWDVYLRVKTGPGVSTSVFEANHTSNQAEMIFWAGGEPYLWDVIDGMRADEAVFILGDVIEKCEAEGEKLSRFDSSNGWGTAASCLQFLRKIYCACLDHPFTTVRVSR